MKTIQIRNPPEALTPTLPKVFGRATLKVMPTSVRRDPTGRVRRRRSRGFTITELMAVVAIMAVLATLAISAFRRKVFASDVTQAQVVLRSISAAEEPVAEDHVELDGQHPCENNSAAGAGSGFDAFDDRRNAAFEVFRTLVTEAADAVEDALDFHCAIDLLDGVGDGVK